MLTPDDLRDIVGVLDSAALDELYVETADLSITLRRDGAHGDWTVESRLTREPSPQHLQGGDDADAAEHDVGAPAGTAGGGEDRTGTEGLHRVTPPLLGTFYRAPKPGAPPFVEVGSTVGPDTVVGIIETMKMMSSVYAGVSGVVSRICVDDAQFVDPDTALMLVEESS